MFFLSSSEILCSPRDFACSFPVLSAAIVILHVHYSGVVSMHICVLQDLPCCRVSFLSPPRCCAPPTCVESTIGSMCGLFIPQP
jgi:hypothetical protein